MLAAWAEATSRIELGPLVACNSYRNPNLLADMARTVDRISGGRVVLGVGSGWFQRDYDEYGYRFGTAVDRLKDLETSLGLIRSRLGQLVPPPARRMPILIAGSGEKRTLRLVAEHADGWHAGFPDAPSELEPKVAALRGWCERVGRDPAEIEWGVGVEPEDLDRFLEQDAATYVEMGFTQFTLGFNGPAWTVDAAPRGLRGRRERGLAQGRCTVQGGDVVVDQPPVRSRCRPHGVVGAIRFGGGSRVTSAAHGDRRKAEHVGPIRPQGPHTPHGRTTAPHVGLCRRQDRDLRISARRPRAGRSRARPASGPQQASQRPPRADHVEVDVGAVAGDDVAKVLLVCEREGGEVEQRVALGRLGPVDDAGDLVTVDEDVGDLQVAVGEHRCPRPERSLGDPAVARDHVGGKDVVGDEPLALAVEVRCDLVGLDLPWAAASCSVRRHRRRAWTARRPAPPWGAGAARAFRHRISGVGTGAIAIASTSTSVRV